MSTGKCGFLVIINIPDKYRFMLDMLRSELLCEQVVVFVPGEHFVTQFTRDIVDNILSYNRMVVLMGDIDDRDIEYFSRLDACLTIQITADMEDAKDELHKHVLPPTSDSMDFILSRVMKWNGISEVMGNGIRIMEYGSHFYLMGDEIQEFARTRY